MENYKNLFHIERAFRMSKTALRIRPIYHRLRHRIEAHICIAFTAYTVYKEPERVLKEENASISLKTASEITHNMYRITYQLPDSRYIKSTLLKMDEQQSELYQIVQKKFQGVAMRKTRSCRGFIACFVCLPRFFVLCCLRSFSENPPRL